MTSNNGADVQTGAGTQGNPETVDYKAQCEELKKRLDEMEKKLQTLMMRSNLPGKPEEHDISTEKGDKGDEDKNELKPMHGRDIKTPDRYDGSKKEFLAWHEGFTSMLYCRHSNWKKVVDGIRDRQRDMRFKNADEFVKAINDPGVNKQAEEYQKQLYNHLLDALTGQPKSDLVAAGMDGVYETYRRIVHRGLNVTEDTILDVEAKVLQPRKAKNEGDVLKALQEWKYDMRWLQEATKAKDRTSNLKPHFHAILLKLLPEDSASNSIKRYMREKTGTLKEYDDFEDELVAELHRRGADKQSAEKKPLNAVADPSPPASPAPSPYDPPVQQMWCNEWECYVNAVIGKYNEGDDDYFGQVWTHE